MKPGPIRACPFCGASGKKVQCRGVSSETATGQAVECDCGASGTITRTEVAAVKAWNKVATECARWRRAVG